MKALALFAVACGTVVGATAAIALEHPTPRSLCDRMTWFGQRAEPGGPDYAGSQAALFDLMAFVPNHAVARDAAPMLSYADYDAIVAAAYHKVLPDADFGVLPVDDAIMGLMRTNTGAAQYTQNVFAARDEMADAMGFGPADVRRSLEFGQPPAMGMVLGLDPDTGFEDAIDAALSARDFGRRMIHGVPVWHHLEDMEFDRYNINRADPFGGNIGRSERIALFLSALAGAPAWELVEAMVGAAIGKDPAILDDETVCAVAAAMTDPSLPGELLQFMIVNPADVMTASPDIQISGDADDISLQIEEHMAQPGELPPYLLAAFADRFTGDSDEAVIALAYRNADTAAAAAEVLAERMAGFQPMTVLDAWAEMMEMFNAEIGYEVIAPMEDGPAVALVRIVTDPQFPTDDTEDGLRRHGGRAFHMLVRSLYSRELTPLVATLE